MPSTSSGITHLGLSSHASLTDGWVGHPFDPIGCLFDTLAEASLSPEDNTSHRPCGKSI